jgi:tetratricopeptide (TPR) repeat protein
MIKMLRYLIFVGAFFLPLYTLPAQTKTSALELEKAGKNLEAAKAFFAEALGQSESLAIKSISSALGLAPDLKEMLRGLNEISARHSLISVRAYAWRELIDIHVAQGEYTKARELCQKIVAYDSQAWQYRHLSAALALYLGSIEELRVELDEAFRLGPAEPWFSRFVLVSALWLGQQDRYVDASRLLEEQVLSKENSTPDSYLCAAILARQAGNLAVSQQYENTLQAKWPNSSAAKVISKPDFYSLHPVFQVLGVPTVKEYLSSSPAPTEPSGNSRIVQMGLFSVLQNAQGLAQRIKAKFTKLSPDIKENNGKYRVTLTVPADTAPDLFLLELKEAGFEGFLD